MTRWTPERWQRASQVLDQLLDLPDEAVDEALPRLCGDDDGLRADVRALLAADRSTDPFLSTPAPERAAGLVAATVEPDPIGEVLGAWRIVQALGEGGMGRVYAAERVDGFSQRAALKLLRSDRLRGDARARFLHERQILARLDHPLIARVLDGGVTGDGRPWFAMELVDGRPVTTFCREAGAGLAERLRLFLQVCEAVRYAHARLVVHRDLKPSNILVDATGRPRLLDFGIAKLMAGDEAADPELATRTIARLMTPEYAAPEQVSGGVITTATDVWALGVLLHELLTGRRPFVASSAVPGALERAILEDDPAPLAAMATGGPVPASALRGDLDRIVTTALRKDPAQRYPSVEALAEDLRRFLDGRPVLARGDSTTYRAFKFVRRHRVGMAAAALVVLAIVAGIAATLVQTQRARTARALAERRVEEVRQLVNTLLFDFNDAAADLPGAAAARERVNTTAIEYLDRITGPGSDVPPDGALAAAWERVGDVAVAAGDGPRALRSYQRAHAIRTALVPAGDTRAALLATARGLRPLGDAMYLGDVRDSAFVLYRAAAAAAEQLAGDSTRDSLAGHLLVAANARLCDRLEGAVDDARRACRLATRVGARLLEREPNNDRFRSDVANLITREQARLAEHPAGPDGLREGVEAARLLASLTPADLSREPRIGRWKLRPKGGRRYSPFTTCTVEAVGRDLRFTYTDDAGHRVMQITFDPGGGPVPVLGPDGRPFATISVRRLDVRHSESWGDGLPYIYERATVSEDGLTWTSEARMRRPFGPQYTDVDVWEKQPGLRVP